MVNKHIDYTHVNYINKSSKVLCLAMLCYAVCYLSGGSDNLSMHLGVRTREFWKTELGSESILNSTMNDFICGS